jgi:hypothetical protein
VLSGKHLWVSSHQQFVGEFTYRARGTIIGQILCIFNEWYRKGFGKKYKNMGQAEGRTLNLNAYMRAMSQEDRASDLRRWEENSLDFGPKLIQARRIFH